MLRSDSALRTGSDRTSVSPRRSARPTSVIRSSSFWAELVFRPTHPSAVASMPGNMIMRPGPGGTPPIIRHIRSW